MSDEINGYIVSTTGDPRMETVEIIIALTALLEVDDLNYELKTKIQTKLDELIDRL